MNHKEHNGWYNYETWAVALWMDNDEGSQERWADEAQTRLKMARGDADEATYGLETAIKVQHEESVPELQGFAADLLNAAMSEVNWREIARHLVEDAIAEAAA